MVLTTKAEQPSDKTQKNTKYMYRNTIKVAVIKT